MLTRLLFLFLADLMPLLFSGYKPRLCWVNVTSETSTAQEEKTNILKQNMGMRN